jgi:hypothetical protein
VAAAWLADEAANALLPAGTKRAARGLLEHRIGRRDGSMVEPIDDVNVAPDELDPGTTAVLTVDGWEAVPYVDPDDSWALQEDGSWMAPDGLTRSWPLAAPEPPARAQEVP